MSMNCFQQFTSLIHDWTGVTIGSDRQAMLVGRIRRRLSPSNCKSYEDYFEHVKNNKEEQAIFIDLVTTHETYFYRTPRIWNYLCDQFIPNWFSKNQSKKFSAWSAAASSGEEAHTLSIFCEEFKRQNSLFSFQILGTDISTDVVNKASQGNFSERAIRRFQLAKPDLVKKYISPANETGRHQVSNKIRGHIQFKSHNLFEKLSTQNKFDLVLLRNVLIYFTKEDQEKVLSHIKSCLSKDGILIIGESESLNNLNSDFQLISPLIYSCNPEHIQSLGKAA